MDGQARKPAGEGGGYQPQLKRSLGQFQVFAVSFAFISVAVGIFGTYDDVLRTAGPVGIWLWAIVAIGQTFVALVIAQFAARIPLTGSSYQWASRLASPAIGWWFGLLSFLYLGIAVVAVDNALATQALMPLLKMPADESVGRMLTLAILVVQAGLTIFSTRLVAMINAAAVGIEVVIVLLLVLLLSAAVFLSGAGGFDHLVSRGVAASDMTYFSVGGGLMLSMLMGLSTLVGFDASANLAEEARDPFRTVPRAIVGSVVAAGLLGMVFLIALTVAIPDIGTISASASPVADILRDRLGPTMETCLMLAVTFAFFACGMVVMATAARLVFAMARDGRFPASRIMARVHPRTHTPIPATVLILVGGILLMLSLPGEALLQLITASTILPVLSYGVTVILYLAVRHKLDRQAGAFDLGRAELPVAVVALLWLAIALFVLVTPPAAFVPVLIVAGLLALGGVYFVWILRFNRAVLAVEPGPVLPPA